MFNTTLCYIEKDGAYLMIHRIKKKNDMNKDLCAYIAKLTKAYRRCEI